MVGQMLELIMDESAGEAEKVGESKGVENVT